MAVCAMAAQCVLAGRLDDGRRFCEAAEARLDDLRYSPGPFGSVPTLIGQAYAYLEDLDRYAELGRFDIDRSGDPTTWARSTLGIGLTLAGRYNESRALAAEVLAAAEQRANPFALADALLAYGMAWRDADPTAAMHALRRGLDIARRSANATTESFIQIILADLEVDHGHIHNALDLLESAIANLHDAGDTSTLRTPLASLTVCLDRMGQHEAAATLVGVATTTLTVAVVGALPATTTHLRELLGDQRVETLSARGTALEPAELVSYALEQIEHVRTMV
jgi:tetratricopeptide (TPR) repeat protein